MFPFLALWFLPFLQTTTSESIPVCSVTRRRLRRCEGSPTIALVVVLDVLLLRHLLCLSNIFIDVVLVLVYHSR